MWAQLVIYWIPNTERYRIGFWVPVSRSFHAPAKFFFSLSSRLNLSAIVFQMLHIRVIYIWSSFWYTLCTNSRKYWRETRKNEWNGMKDCNATFTCEEMLFVWTAKANWILFFCEILFLEICSNIFWMWIIFLIGANLGSRKNWRVHYVNNYIYLNIFLLLFWPFPIMKKCKRFRLTTIDLRVTRILIHLTMVRERAWAIMKKGTVEKYYWLNIVPFGVYFGSHNCFHVLKLLILYIKIFFPLWTWNFIWKITNKSNRLRSGNESPLKAI